MKYIVMECHPGYAIVLDEEGRFLRVANIRYEVGQTVTDVVEMQVPQSLPIDISHKRKRWMYSLATAAAAFILMFSSLLGLSRSTYASIYMSINPEVRIDVNRYDKVLALEGINSDGKKLLQGYDYEKKKLNPLMEELVERAIEMGYLHEGGQITLLLDSKSGKWVDTHSVSLSSRLNEYVTDEKLSIAIEVGDKNNRDNKILIPIDKDDSDYGDTDDDDPDYYPEDDDMNDYNDTDVDTDDMDDDDSDDDIDNDDTDDINDDDDDDTDDDDLDDEADDDDDDTDDDDDDADDDSDEIDGDDTGNDSDDIDDEADDDSDHSPDDEEIDDD